MSPEISDVLLNKVELAKDIKILMSTGTALLEKDKLESSDYGKIKVIKTLGSIINSQVAIVQQETARERIQLIRERMTQLGYATGVAKEARAKITKVG